MNPKSECPKSALQQAARRTRSLGLSLIVLLTGTLVACKPTTVVENTAPGSTAKADPAPSVVNRPTKPAPVLNVTSGDITAAANTFVDWAADSTLDQREEGRAAIQAAQGNNAMAEALTKIALDNMNKDHSRALIALSVLGEMRNPVGEKGLTQIVNMPLPDAKPTGFEGEVPERTALATLEAKAIEGVAYMKSRTSFTEVLTQISRHPSKTVRSAAIKAFLYNYGDNPDTRGLLSQYVQENELILIDRPVRDIGESGESFNQKLEVFLKLHPEVQPPNPDKGETVGPPLPDVAGVTMPPSW